MGSNKKKQETGGLQAPKHTVTEREEIKTQKELDKKREKKKREKKVKDRPNIFVRTWRGIRNIGGELKKVRWPSFNRTVAQTGVVLGVVIIFSLIIFGMDMGLGELYRLLTRGL